MGNLGVFTQGFRPKKEVDLFVTYFELRGMLVYDMTRSGLLDLDRTPENRVSAYLEVLDRSWSGYRLPLNSFESKWSRIGPIPETRFCRFMDQIRQSRITSGDICSKYPLLWCRSGGCCNICYFVVILYLL